MAQPPSPSPHGTPVRLPVLDGLRLLAALGVMLFHVPALHGVTPFFERTYLLVDFFFLLSGFVLTLAIEPRLNDGLGGLTFLRQRFVRFWPIAAIGTALGAFAFAGQVPLGQILFLLPLAALMIPLPNASGAPLFPLNGPQWSLFWELAANLFHALFLRHMSPRGLLGLAGLFGIGLAALAIIHDSAAFGAQGAAWWAAAFRIGWSYTLGCWFARGWHRRQTTTRIPWWAAMALPVIGACLLPFLPLGTGAGDALLIILVFPPCLHIASRARCPQALERPLQRLGAMSFPLYATHIPVLMIVRLRSESLVAGVAAIGAALLLAAVIARLDAARRLRPGALLPALRSLANGRTANRSVRPLA